MAIVYVKPIIKLSKDSKKQQTFVKIKQKPKKSFVEILKETKKWK